MNQETNSIGLSKRYHTEFEVYPFQTQSLEERIYTIRKERALKKIYDYADNQHIFGFFGFLIEEPENLKPQVLKASEPKNKSIYEVKKRARKRIIIRGQKRQNNLIRNQNQNRQIRILRQIQNRENSRKAVGRIRTIQSRRFNKSPGLLISAIKKLSRDFVFDRLYVSEMDHFQIAAECFEQMKIIIRKLSSQIGVRRQIRMIFNLNDPVLNRKIESRTKKTKAEEDFLNLLDEFGSFVVDLIKKQFKDLLFQAMNPEWMKGWAERREFYAGVESAKTTYRRDQFHKYVQHFRSNLESDYGILEKLDRRAFASQFEKME